MIGIALISAFGGYIAGVPLDLEIDLAGPILRRT
jgi:hypothetical protein